MLGFIPYIQRVKRFAMNVCGIKDPDRVHLKQHRQAGLSGSYTTTGVVAYESTIRTCESCGAEEIVYD